MVRNNEAKICNPLYLFIRKFTTVLSSVLLFTHSLNSNFVHCIRDTDSLGGASHCLEYII